MHNGCAAQPSSMEHPSSGSKRTILRNSLALGDPRMAYVLYDQPPNGHPLNVELDTFLPSETYLDQTEHMVADGAMFQSPHDDHDIIVTARGSPLGMHHQPEDELMYGLIEGKLMQQPEEEFATTRNDYGQIGIYGWRKKTVFFLLLIIVLLVGINAVLTFWIVSFLGFSSNGISGLDLSRDNQVVFQGNAIFERLLFASEIGSYNPSHKWLRFVQPNGNISFRSSWAPEASSSSEAQGNVQLASDRIDSKLTVAKGRVLVEADNFELYDRQKRLLFAINCQASSMNGNTSNSSNHHHHQMTIQVDSLNIQNLNSLRLPLSLQTPLVESSSSEEMKIISPHGRLLLRGPSSVAIESKFGDASLMTFQELRLKSNRGKVTLESSNGIYIRKLTTITADQGNTSTSNSILQRLRQPKVYQLCVCQSGKLFLVKPDQECAVNSGKDCL